MRDTDVRVVAAQLHLLPVETRVPLKFGTETLTSVTCARVCITVEDANGRRADGWGETPLSVQWVWPSELSFKEREAALEDFTRRLAAEWVRYRIGGHPLELGHAFAAGPLRELALAWNATWTRGRAPTHALPWLAALVCSSPYDLALHDAFGKLHGLSTYSTYGKRFLTQDLASFLEPATGSEVTFQGRYPEDYLVKEPPTRLPAWHLVGGLDAIDRNELDGSEPDDGYPVLLEDWVRRDGLTCLKVKLRGNDAPWDYSRVVRVGHLAIANDALWLTVDFNCTVTEPAYVNEILDRLVVEQPRLYGMILYVEQPFPYDLEAHQIDVHSVSARKPLFMDESAHDWELVRLGRQLGWTGVALKTCKTQTGALLSLAWAKAHGMTLMVQDLTNPMLAQIPHVLLAAHAGTIMGVETNSMQFYPEASGAEAAVHPGLYQRHGGVVDLSTIDGPGFGYRLDQIQRELAPPDCQA